MGNMHVCTTDRRGLRILASTIGNAVADGIGSIGRNDIRVNQGAIARAANRAFSGYNGGTLAVGATTGAGDGTATQPVAGVAGGGLVGRSASSEIPADDILPNDIVVTASQQMLRDIRMLSNSEFQGFEDRARREGWEAWRENAEIHSYAMVRNDLQLLKSGTSFALDNAPGLGTLKGAAQALTGNDLITGEPVSRAFEAASVAASVIPFGKLGSKVLARAAERIAQTGAGRTIPYWDFPAAHAAYDVIRGSNSDILRIAENTGMKDFQVARIKEHLFYATHELDGGVIARLDAHPEIANAWNRLTAGSHTAGDMQLLQHELFEAKFEGIFRTSNREAHYATLRSGRYSGIDGQ